MGSDEESYQRCDRAYERPADDEPLAPYVISDNSERPFEDSLAEQKRGTNCSNR